MNQCESCRCLGGYHMTTCSLYNEQWDGYPRKPTGFARGDDLVEHLVKSGTTLEEHYKKSKR